MIPHIFDATPPPHVFDAKPACFQCVTRMFLMQKPHAFDVKTACFQAPCEARAVACRLRLALAVVAILYSFQEAIVSYQLLEVSFDRFYVISVPFSRFIKLLCGKLLGQQLVEREQRSAYALSGFPFERLLLAVLGE